MKSILNECLSKLNDYLLPFLIGLVVLFILPTILVQFIIYIIELRYKVILRFQLFKFHRLASIQLTKLNSVNANEKLIEIFIDGLWFSSCYLNRQVNDRILLCLSSLSITYYKKQDSLIKQKSNDLLTFLAYFYLKYIGSLSIASLNLKYSKYQGKLNVTLENFRIESIQSKGIKPIINIEYSNFNLKLFDQRFQLNAQLSVKKTNLHLEINKIVLFKSDSISRIDLLDSVKFYLENTNCLFNANNKLINLDISYDKNYYLIDYFNNIEFSSLSKSNSSSFLKKIKVISIKNYQCIILNEQLTEKNKKIKLDEITLANDTSEKHILVKNLVYSSDQRDRNKFNILTKFYFFIGISESNHEFNVECEQLNSCFHFKFIKDIINSKLIKSLIDNSKANHVNKSIIKSFNLKALNSYFHLNDDSTMIYSVGANNLVINKKDELKIDIKQPIIFKSTLASIKSKIFLNNLFEMMSINNNCLNNKNNHYWGNLMSLDRLQFKMTSDSLVIFTIGSLSIEYSIDNFNLLNHFIDYYKQIDRLNILVRNSSSKMSQVKFKLRSIDFFLLFKNKYLLNFRLNDLNYKLLDKSFNFRADSLTCVKYHLNDVNKISEYIQPVSYCFIEQTNKISNSVLLIEEIHLNRSFNIYYLVNKSIELTWSLETHYILYETIFEPLKALKTHKSSQELNKFKLLVELDILINLEFDYKQDSSKKSATDSFYLPTTTISDTCTRQAYSALDIQIVSIVLTNPYMSLTNQDELKVNFKEVSMFVNPSHCSEFFTDAELSSSESLLKQRLQNDSNKRQFLTIKSFEINKQNESNLLSYERLLLNTATKSNRLTLVNMEHLSLNFIFNYDFAKLIDHVLNVRKILHKIHNIITDKRNLMQPLPISSDLMVNIKRLQLTIEDDPFEIKLAYNYALMTDEYAESIKRRRALEQRRIIKEQSLEKEAIELLTIRESFIYQQRSNTMYSRNQKFKSQQQQQRAIRTELFCFSIENVEFYALCDLEWHGRQKCYEILRRIDKHSPQSPSMSQSANPSNCYLILWCRYINFSFDEWKFLFRDYTQPLLKLNRTNFFGHLVGAELEPAPRAKRDVKISIFQGKNLKDDESSDSISFSIERSMSPVKFYHDLCSKMSLFQIAYGPCWEGTMAQFNLALDKIIHPARDPSRPMPWWDKSRLYLHGNFTAQVQQLQIIYHVSMDPYNRTDCMKWVWSQLYFDWTNMQMIFKGDLDIYLNTESKYDDCRFLHLPNLELKIKIEWICKNKNLANSHNNVMPCAPDKLPVIINSSEHDSYGQFRSENVNLSLSFICSSCDEMPTCKFYSSTSRFIQRIKTLLSTITRPIRRGKIFRNLKLRKAILSRHFKIVNINFDIPKLNIVYWSSASEEYGIILECEHFRLNSSHKLDLLPFVEQLKRRPKPCWSIEIMKCKLAQTTIFLMCPLSQKIIQPLANNNTTNENERSIKFFESERVIKSFFMQIDSIFYEREKYMACSKNSVFEEKRKSLEHEDLVHSELEDDLLLLSNVSKLNDKKKSKFLSYSFKTSAKNSKIFNSKTKTGSFKAPSPSKQPASEPQSINQNSFNINKNSNRDENTLKNFSLTNLIPFSVKNTPKHNILVSNLKAKWNNINRDVIYILYEIYNKSKRLRHNISSAALKEYDLLTDHFVQSFAVNNNQSQNTLSRKSSVCSINFKQSLNNSHSIPFASINNDTKTFFEELLNKLDAEREINSEIYCDEKKIAESSNYNDLLYGVHAANKMSDIISENIFIEFTNSQVKLSLESDSVSDPTKLKQQSQQQSQSTWSTSKLRSAKHIDSSFDCFDDNYLIISAAKANVVQRLHKPVWKSQRLLDKVSWNGYLEGMQYFATLDTNSEDKEKLQSTVLQLQQVQNEYWLTDDIIDLNEQPNHFQSNVRNKLADEISNSGSSSGSVPPTAGLEANPNKNNLGMLISYNINSNTDNIQQDTNNINRQKVDDTIKEKKPRFGFGKSNRKLTKPDLSTDLLQPSTAPTIITNSRNLQLIVSKCRCEFFMIDFDDKIPNADECLSQYQNSSFNYSHLYQKLERQASNDENLFCGNQSTSTLNNQIDLNATFNEPIDCFSLIHYDLNLCTNSKQFKMIMNLVNNLVLYFRPRRKQVIDKQKSIKFNLQLSMGDLESLKTHIQQMQIEAKELLCKIRAMERKLYHLRERIQSEIKFYQGLQEQQFNDHSSIANQLFIIQELNTENINMEKDYRDNKNRLNELSDELNISISCYKEIILEKRAYTLANTTQYLLSTNNGSTNSIYNSNQSVYTPIQKFNYFTNARKNRYNLNNIKTNDTKQQPIGKKNNEGQIKLEQAQQSILNNEIGKRYEIWFKNTEWNLNEDDGQTGCAQFLVRNFLYTKVTNQQELDCVEHTLEVESCKLKDLSEVVPNVNNNNKQKDKANKILENFVLAPLFDESFNVLTDDDEHHQDFDDETTSVFDDLLPKSEPNADTISDRKSLDNDLMSSAINNNSTMIRVYCKERPPIGIPVFEHIELNVSPLSINLTNNFFKMMMNFFLNNQSANSSTQPSSQALLQASQNEPRVMNNKNESIILNRNNNYRHSYHNHFYIQNDDQPSNLMQLNLNTLPNTNPASSSISPLSIDTINNSSSFGATSPTSSSALSSNYISNTNQQSLQSPNPPCKQNRILPKKPSQSSLFNNNVSSSLETQNSLSVPTQSSLPSHTSTSNLSSNNAISSQLQNDDIEIMKQRSANNNTFLCIKIPEIQLLVSYRATNKDKNIKDFKTLKNVSLLFPLFEIHDKTWTYVDLVNSLKSHVKKALVSQALKHKLIKIPIQPVNKLINRTRRFNSQQHLTNMEIDEHEKLTILKLFGTKFIEKKSSNTIIQNPISIQIDANEAMHENEGLNSKLIAHQESSELINCKPENNLTTEENEAHSSKQDIQTKKLSKLKKPLLKSNSLLYFKKHFLRLNTNNDTLIDSETPHTSIKSISKINSSLDESKN